MPACTNNGTVTVNNVKIKNLLQFYLLYKTIISIMALFSDTWSFDGKTIDEVVRAYTAFKGWRTRNVSKCPRKGISFPHFRCLF